MSVFVTPQVDGTSEQSWTSVPLPYIDAPIDMTKSGKSNTFTIPTDLTISAIPLNMSSPSSSMKRTSTVICSPQTSQKDVKMVADSELGNEADPPAKRLKHSEPAAALVCRLSSRETSCSALVLDSFSEPKVEEPISFVNFYIEMFRAYVEKIMEKEDLRKAVLKTLSPSTFVQLGIELDEEELKFCQEMNQGADDGNESSSPLSDQKLQEYLSQSTMFEAVVVQNEELKKRLCKNSLAPPDNRLDKFVYCDACKHQWNDLCPVGHQLHVHNPLQNPMNKIPGSDNVALPEGLKLGPSVMPESPFGIKATQYINPGVIWGPYKTFSRSKLASDKTWEEILLEELQNANQSSLQSLHWMSYINYGRTEAEINNVSFMSEGLLYYKTIRQIKPNEELFSSLWLENDKHNAKSTGGNVLSRLIQEKLKLQVYFKNNQHEEYSEFIKQLNLNYAKGVMTTEEFKMDNQINEVISAKNYNTPVMIDGVSIGSYPLSDSIESDEPKTNDFIMPLAVDLVEMEKPVKYRKRPKRSKYSYTVTLEDPDKPYACDECGKRFADNSNMVRHKRTHTGEKPYICDQCGKGFTTSSHLTVHKRTHTGEKPFTCDECGMKFTRSVTLKVHKRTHSGIRPYVCDECGKRFTDSSNMASHKRTHTGEKPYECDVCNMKFARSITLTIHKRQHTGERPYVCSVCGKSFTDNRNLTSHMRKHTGEKPYACDECGMRFIQSSHVTSHKKSHSGERPHVCEYCGKAFSQKEHLKTHIRTHTGEKPFVCEECNVRFTTNGSLTIHKRGHANIKPYSCDVCGKCFTRSTSLKVHKKLHISNIPMDLSKSVKASNKDNLTSDDQSSNGPTSNDHCSDNDTNDGQTSNTHTSDDHASTKNLQDSVPC